MRRVAGKATAVVAAEPSAFSVACAAISPGKPPILCPPSAAAPEGPGDRRILMTWVKRKGEQGYVGGYY